MRETIIPAQFIRAIYENIKNIFRRYNKDRIKKKESSESRERRFSIGVGLSGFLIYNVVFVYSYFKSAIISFEKQK